MQRTFVSGSQIYPLPDGLPRIRVSLLMSFQVEVGSATLETTEWPRNVRALLAMLAASPRHQILRDTLVDRLWPDATPEAGSSNTRRVVHLLRRRLGADDPWPVLLDQQWIRLNEAFEWEIDLDVLHTTLCADDQAHLAQVAELLGVEPLEEFKYDDWAIPIREQVVRSARDVYRRLATGRESRADTGLGARWLERALAMDPLDEEIVRELMRLYGDAGRTTEAVRTFRSFERRVRDELDVDPAPETVALLPPHFGDADPVAVPAATAPPPTRPRAISTTPVLPVENPLVGREQHMSSVRSFLGQSESSILLLTGEAGAGKTRLLAEILSQHRDPGRTVLVGRCYRAEVGIPYGPIHDALLDWARSVPYGVLGEACNDIAPQLIPVLPELRTLGVVTRDVRDSEHSRDDRLGLFVAVRSLIERLSVPNGLILLLDDLHWADQATLELLHWLERHPIGAEFHVVGTFRAGETGADSKLQFLTGDRQTVGTRTVELGTLSVSQIRALLAGHLQGECSPSLAETMHSRCDGNPLFCLQMVRLLRHRGDLIQASGAWQLSDGAELELPSEVRQVVGRRIHELRSEHREVLAFVATLGREVEFAPLELMWAGSENELFAGLDAAVEVGILEEIGDRYVFRHPLLHEVVHDMISEVRRTRLHARAGETLEQYYGVERDAHAAELAEHFAHGGSQRRDHASRYLRLAAENAMDAYAWADAVQHFRRALRFTNSFEEQLKLQERLAQALELSDRASEALDVLLQVASAHSDAGNVEAEVRVVTAAAHVQYSRGLAAAGLDQILRLESRVEGRCAPCELSGLYSAHARLAWATGRVSEARLAAERAIELAQAAHDPPAFRRALTWQALALSVAGPYDEALAASEEAIALAQAAGEQTALYIPLTLAGESCIIQGKFTKARAHWEHALSVARATRSLTGEGFTLANMAEICFLIGDWHSATEFATASIQVLERWNTGWARPYGRLQLAHIQTAQGAWAEARSNLETVSSYAACTLDSQAMDGANLGRAEIAMRENRPADALEYLAHIERTIDPANERYLLLLDALARARLQIDDLCRAEAYLDEAVERARCQGHRLALTHVLFTLGSLRRRQMSWPEAHDALDESTQLAEHMPYPLLQGRVLLEQGLVEAAQGHRRRAGNSLAEAIVLLERIGAAPDLEAARGALSRL